MKIYIVKYPEPHTFYLDEQLNYEPCPLNDSYPSDIVASTPQNGDTVLFYSTFVDCKNTESSVIFAYFQIGLIEKGFMYPAKTLSFDNTRAGCGLLNYSKKRTLTRYGSDKNCWSLPEFFRCLDLRSKDKSVLSSFRQNGVIRYFDASFDCLSVSLVPSKDSLVYYENALLEWLSSMCEDVRGEATRRFNSLKKGDTGAGKTGFVKYDYIPDSRRAFYCRLNHTVGKRCMRACDTCPMYKTKGKRRVCEWSLPVYGALPYLPLTTADAYAYFDVLLEKGLVMDYRD